MQERIYRSVRPGVARGPYNSILFLFRKQNKFLTLLLYSLYIFICMYVYV